MFVDSDHAGDKVSHRSRSGFFIYMNTGLVQWFSKNQSSVETSVFSAEFVAMKQGLDAVRDLRYKQWIMGISISGPSYIYGDNVSVMYYTSRPESVLRKKSSLVCYHAVLQSIAIQKSFMGKRENIWSTTFFMIFMITIGYWFQSVQTTIRQA